MKLLTILIITILITGCGSKNINTPEKSKFDNPISIEAVDRMQDGSIHRLSLFGFLDRPIKADVSESMGEYGY